MPFTGSAPSKVYTRTDGTRTGSAVNVTADGAGVNNTAALADNRENDIATALSTSWQINGDNQPNANLPMNSKKFTGMAQGSARTDSLRIDQVQDGDLIYAGTVGGTANAIDLTTAPTCEPVEGMTIVFIPASDSTSTVTLDLNGNGAVALQYNAAALSGQELQAGLPARVTHDGTVWQLENSARLSDLNALAKTDGNIPVGNGTNWVAESGATARTSLGLGTGNSPQFTGIELGHATDTTLTRPSAGNMAIEGNLVYRAGGTDVPVADGGTGASDAADARTNLGLATVGQSEAEAGTATTTRAWTAQRVAQAIAAQKLVPATVQATTSGTAFDFTGIPAGVNRITVILNGVSLSGTDALLIQIGDSGGIETTGYAAYSGNRASETASTAGFNVRSSEATQTVSGSVRLERITGNTWVQSHVVSTGNNTPVFGGGTKTLSAELTQVRLTRAGTDTFDAGQVNIFYE